jgi:integrase
MIREGKFRKSRLLPIHESTAGALARYLSRRREAGVSAASEAPLFVNLKGHPLVYENIRQTFSRLCKSAGLDCPPQRTPRIHDLRHSFAVGRVIAWYRAGIDVNTRLGALSTYLGHVSVEKTLVYLRPHQEMLSEAARRFEAACAPPLDFPREES